MDKENKKFFLDKPNMISLIQFTTSFLEDELEFVIKDHFIFGHVVLLLGQRLLDL